MSSIRISQLNSFSTIKTDDFIPLVESSSLTTYRVTLTSFNSWFADSGSVLSASWASSSLTARSASWASSSISSSTTSHLMYPNTSTASYAMTGLSASWANSAGTAITSVSTTGTASYATTANSSSYAGSSSMAITASYFNFSLPSSTPPFASASLSASWASASLSSSFATTSSYSGTASFAINTSAASTVVKAFGTFYATGSLTTPYIRANLMPFSGSYNFISASYQGNRSTSGDTNGMLSSSMGKIPFPQTSYGSYHTWIFHMSTPMPTKNYTVISACGGEQGSEWMEMTCFPLGARTTSAFSLSLVAYDTNWDSRTTEINWMSLMVLHP